ncbi:hypothetical protein [Hymenobacter sp. 5414T-23]|uniref:hypothetical protein n=1 Tax=Hymenobacter sp. 5414T-23 TaxID=2932252 RepID=UPI00293E7F2B|nr:hypothetical protein [Hymenobacter sp. 5414T-23]
MQTLLQRYGLNSKPHVQQFKLLNRKNLTAKGGLIVGRKYLLPNPGATRATSTAKAGSSRGISTTPLLPSTLFGPVYSPVAVRDRALRGAVYYLSPGHGAPTLALLVRTAVISWPRTSMPTM